MSDAATFVADHARSVLVTRRRDGGLQASPVRVLVDSSGALVAITRAATAKARNLIRDPRFTLCSISDGWTGPWMTIEGSAEVHELPGALDRLRDFYAQRDGSLPPDDEFRATMEREGRVLIEFTVERSTPPPPPR
jgi:PPOX class probable F420-dependent enzyme